MAVIRANSELDMSNFSLWKGELEEQSPSRATVSDGYRTAQYNGNFAYNNYGDVFGTLMGFKIWWGSDLTLKVTNVRADMYDFWSGVYSDNEDYYYYDTRNPWKDILTKADEIYGSAENDVLYGGAKDDWIRGNKGHDSLFGDAGNDELIGGKGGDHLYGKRGDDVLRGGDGNDQLDGSSGNDKLFGGNGDDRLYGSSGTDILKGGEGDDYLYCWKGDNILNGGIGNDHLVGSYSYRYGGKDVFVFREGFDRDTISNFHTDEDRIRLSDNLWEGSLTKVQVIDAFAQVRNGNTIFDFGEDQLVIKDFTEIDELRDDLVIV